MFPGQGSQAVGMGCDLCAADSLMRDTYAEASAELGYDLQALCAEGPPEKLARTDLTQPALLADSIGILRILRREGLRFGAAFGHSLGEYSALVATGAVAFRDALLVVRRRGEEMLAAAAASPGGMIAILGLDDATVEELCAGIDGVWPANFNSSGQVVVSGREAALTDLAEKAKTAGARRVIPLAVSGAFHSPLVAPAAAALHGPLAATPWAAPRPAFFSTCSAGFEDGGFAALLERQLVSPVRFEESIRRLAAEGYNHYLEVGPGTVLAGLVKRIDRDAVTAGAGDLGSLSAALDSGWTTTLKGDR